MYAVGDWVNVGALGALGRVVDVQDVSVEAVDVGPTAMVWAQAEVADAEPPVVTALTLAFQTEEGERQLVVEDAPQMGIRGLMSADRARAGRKALGIKPRGPVPAANRAYRDALGALKQADDPARAIESLHMYLAAVRKQFGGKVLPRPDIMRVQESAMAIGAEMDAVLEADGAVVAEMAALFT